MVASDTVVGIVGAVVLVAVMAGVFIYEYNNPVTDGAMDEDAAHFVEHYPALDAYEDLDGDGLANWQDGDIDGDGSNDTDDVDVGVYVPVSGSRPTLAPGSSDSGQSFAFYIGTGMVHLEATVTYSSTTPSPVPATPSFTFDVRDETGTTLGTAAAARSGTTVTLTFETEDMQPAGNYTLVLRQTQPGAGGNFSGTIGIHYQGKSTLEDDHTH